MGKLKFIFSIVAAAIVLSGCSMSGSITSLDPATPTKVNITSGGEFVSGSHKTEQTLIRRYGIQSSSGSWNGSIQSSTPRGYKVYSSVQGTMISSGN